MITHEKSLWWAFGLTAIFLIAEVIGGLLINSLELLSDAANLVSKEPVLSAHIVLTDELQPPDQVRQSLVLALADTFSIEHATLQVDASSEVENVVHP